MLNVMEVKVTIIVFISCIFFKETDSSFYSFRPLSVIREESLNNRSSFKKLPVLEFIEIVERYGYQAEEHKITTPDGYNLRIHRIPGSPTQPKSSKKPVVYIQHGLFASSDMFVLGGPNQDLAYILADAGYDVWLGNARGNTYSRSHTRLSPNNPKFWAFSFHEIALYDISTAIDYILCETNQQSLVYVAHSMGTTAGLVLLSSKPEYNEKIHLVVNLATVGNWKKPRNFMQFLLVNGDYVKAALIAAGITEVFPQTLANGIILNGMCRDGSVLQQVCVGITQYISGYDTGLLNIKLLTDGFAYFPAGGSRQTLIHLHQNMRAGKLQMYDYGLIGNFARYRQMSPHVYNLENIATPIFMIYGKGDAVSPPEDSLELQKILKNARAESVPHDNFGHLDFLWAKNLKSLLHDRVLEIIRESPKSAKIGNESHRYL